MTVTLPHRLPLAAITSFLFVLLLAAGGAQAGSQEQEAQDLIDNSRTTLETVLANEDMTWLRENIGRARGVIIFPHVIKGGFIFGGSGGSGVMLARKDDSNDWSDPAFYTIGAVTFGLQIGADASQVLMLVMTERGLASLLTSQANLGTGLSIAAGPVGAGAKAATADIVQYNLSKGAFGGVTLDGAVIKVRNGLNSAFYGSDVRPTDILITREARNATASDLVKSVTDAAAGESEDESE
ncbi:MAG: lipid-binding SYLF domain-containing protein [Gammaproteobacteria bacterium]|jgi:lipid-binding SYLF domain-containing protein|nr:lipid-binding SYLF domain-containing protein [Gammaproteobacteria bacterium]